MSLPNSPPPSSTTAVVTPPSYPPESRSIHTSNAENTLPKQPHTTTVPQPQTLDSNSGLINSGLGNIDVNKTEESGEPVEPEKPGAEQLGPEKIVNVETVTVAGIVDENRITANLSSVPTAGSLPENGGSIKPVTGPESGPGIGKKKKIVKRVVKVVKKVIKKKMVMKRVPKKVLVHESINPGIMVNAEESEVTEISSFDNNEIEKSNSVDELNDKPSIVNEANVIPNIAENLNLVNGDVIEKTSIINEVIEKINITNDRGRKSELVSSASISVPINGETLKLDFGASDRRVPANDQISVNAWCTDNVKSCNDEITYDPESLEVENINHIAKNVMETDIFVGGLDKKNTRGDDIRKVFEEVGVVLEVRLMVYPNSVKKNRGFAFVRFATAVDANNALAKCSNVKIRGKQCSVAPVGIIRLGNINKNWKPGYEENLLKKAGIEKIIKFTRKKRSCSSGCSALLEFETREDAHIAFNKLRKKDAFGKNSMVEVEWAEPLIEPDAALRCIEGVGKERSEDHRSKVKPAVSLANRKPTSKPMECTPDWTIKKPPKAKPETIQGTMWRRLVSKDTEQSRSTSEIFAEFHDLPAPVPPPKRPNSSSDGAAPAKKPRRPSGFSSPATPMCPSITTSVHNLTDGEMAAQYIQSLCPSPNRRTLDKLKDTELVDSCCLDHSKAMAKEAVILSRFRRGFANPELTNELDSLKKDNAKLRMEGEKSENLICRLKDVVNVFRTRAKSDDEKIKNLKDENVTLRAELDKVRADCTKQINEARAEGTQAGLRGFPKSRDGLGLIQSVREITKRAFLRSEEFWDILVDGGTFYYSYALDEAEKWALSKGFNEKFEREGPLDHAPDPPCLKFCEEDSRVNSLGPEAFAAHILLQVNRDEACESTLAN